MKGKKFDAAEKHFQKKEARLKKVINDHAEESANLRMKNSYLEFENGALKAENEELKEKLEVLTKLSSLSEEDLKLQLEKDKRSKRALDIFESIRYLR